jgi:tetratricopeptide (TPR) repeat protein
VFVRLLIFLLVPIAIILAQPAPASADASLGKANRLMQQQRYEEAAAEFEHALAVQPDLKLARYDYAVCLFAVGRNDDARREFERLVKEVGPSPESSYYLGRIALLGGDSNGAIRELKSLANNPKISDADYYLGLSYLAAGDEKAGLECLQRAETRNPRDYHVHYRLARFYTTAGKKADADREYALYNQSRDAERETADRMRACNVALDGKDSAHIHEVCGALFDPNDPERLVLLSQLYGGHGDYADALEPLKRATQLDAASFEAWHNLGLTYFRLQRYQDARAPLEKAVELRPDYFDSLNLLGAVLYMNGEDKAALPILRRAHALRPDDAQITAVIRELQQK